MNRHAQLHPSLSGIGNPLIRAATPLLLLLVQLRGMADVPDVCELRESTVANIRRFHEQASSAGADGWTGVAARHVLCMALDEAVLGSSWGDSTGWSRRTLLATFHGEVCGPGKFFEMVDRICQEMARHIDLIVLIYVCMALGFGAQYLAGPEGPSRLTDRCDELYRRIVGFRAARPAELSPNWRGVVRPMKPKRASLPPWLRGLTSRDKRGALGGDHENLPWYLLIGAPGSGKSTLLKRSGFDLPFLDSMTRHSTHVVASKRDWNWWHTERAVFLDTAGHYTTQDSDPQSDASAWNGFLGMLRRYRSRQPVNGIVLTISAGDLLEASTADRQRHAHALSERLDEIGARLGISVPVYLVFTKCDLVAGFADFFAGLDQAGRAQVWGCSFAAQRSVDGGAPTQLGDEFDRLLERIDAGVIERIHAEPGEHRRASILSFPGHLRRLRELALPFMATIFSRHASGRSPLLRGVYLTSAAQEDREIDGVPPVVDHVSPATYFVEDLFKEAILPEAGFVAADPVAHYRRRLAEAAAAGGLGILTVALFVATVCWPQ